MQDVLPALKDFAARYTAAWCSQDPAAVALFFAPTGSLTINQGTSSIGRSAIAETAYSFMSAFPDLHVVMNRVVSVGDRIEYHWTLTGTNTGPGGTGRPVRISGLESWLLDPEGLIAESKGSFDADDYNRQLSGAGSTS